MKWQERLNEHEERPRPQVWAALKERIAVQNSSLADKMLHLEASPPANAWNHIRRRLSEEENHTTTKQPALIRRISRRYASAAAMAASLVLITLLYVFESEKKPDQTANITAAMHGNISERQPTEPVLIESDRQTEAIQNEKSASTPTLPPTNTATPGQQINKISRAAWRTNLSNERESFVRIEPGNNYIQICGHRVECDRLTYKLEEWAACIHERSDNRHASTPTSEKERRIEAWRRMLEQSDYVPAAGHFLDIMEMASLLSRESQ